MLPYEKNVYVAENIFLYHLLHILSLIAKRANSAVKPLKNV